MYLKVHWTHNTCILDARTFGRACLYNQHYFTSNDSKSLSTLHRIERWGRCYCMTAFRALHLNDTYLKFLISFLFDVLWA